MMTFLLNSMHLKYMEEEEKTEEKSHDIFKFGQFVKIVLRKLFFYNKKRQKV